MTPSSNIQKGQDGRYRWVYEVRLLKNYAILWEVYRAFSITAVICFLLVGCIGFCSDGIDGLKDMIPSEQNPMHPTSSHMLSACRMHRILF